MKAYLKLINELNEPNPGNKSTVHLLDHFITPTGID